MSIDVTSPVRQDPPGTARDGLRILFLGTAAFGGRGGIAQFNRHFLTALCNWPKTAAVVAVTCHPTEEPPDQSDLPQGLALGLDGTRGRFGFLRAAMLTALRNGPFDMVVCAHPYLVRTAALIKLVTHARTIGIIYGIDAWTPFPRWTLRRALPALDHVISISQYTTDRFLSWSDFPADHVHQLPLGTDLSLFSPRSARPDLIERYGLKGKTVILTLARLDAGERYKGIDEMIDILPKLRESHPHIAYLVAGDGSDRGRLEAKVRTAGLEDTVTFAGYISDDEKIDHYCLADAFVMCGSGEGFGIVFLEAMGCGIPVVASTLDGSREAVLGGTLGLLANPNDAAELLTAVRKALGRPKGQRPDGLEFFSVKSFSQRVHVLFDHLTDEAP